MLIGFDASRAFVEQATGTENYSLNLLRALSKIDRKNTYRVYLRESQSGKSKWKVKNKNLLYTGDFDFELPNNFELKIIRPFRFWTQIGLALETWRNPVDLLFIPAHTLPILRRRVSRVPQVSRAKSQIHKALGTLGTRDTRTKYVVTIHDLGVEFLPGYHQFPQRYYLDFASKYACRHADAIIAVSGATKGDIVKRYQIDARKVFVVAEGVDTAFFRPQSKVPAKGGSASGGKVQGVKSKYKIDGDYILFVGTVQPRKNLEMLIKAFSLLANRLALVGNEARIVRRDTLNVTSKRNGYRDRNRPTLNLVIAGKLGWDYKEILDAPKKFGVERQVKFLGYVPNGDMPALYSGASVFASPSFFEGFGLPILEAVSCGCPVVASDIGPHREIQLSVLGSQLSESSLSVSQLTGQQKTGKLNSDNRQQKTDNRSVFEPLILVKSNDVDKWVSVLYQYISQYNNKTFRVKTKNLISKFSWEMAAKNTLKIFERMLG